MLSHSKENRQASHSKGAWQRPPASRAQAPQRVLVTVPPSVILNQYRCGGVCWEITGKCGKHTSRCSLEGPLQGPICMPLHSRAIKAGEAKNVPNGIQEDLTS